jgi:hypothetical protein
MVAVRYKEVCASAARQRLTRAVAAYVRGRCAQLLDDDENPLTERVSKARCVRHTLNGPRGGPAQRPRREARAHAQRGCLLARSARGADLHLPAARI